MWEESYLKKIFGKNQIVISVLAIMIAVAGYLSLTHDKTKEVSNIAGADNDAETVDTIETGNDVGPVEIIETGTDAGVTDEVPVIYDLSDEDIENATMAENVASLETPTGSETGGEAVLVSSTIGTGYFDSAKLAREQTRSKNKEILMELINSQTTTDEQKEDAIDKVIGLTTDSEKETAAETMLEAKGFGQSVVSIVDGKVDVIVNATGLTEKEIAQIEDIIKRKTGAEAENIVITPVGVE